MNILSGNLRDLLRGAAQRDGQGGSNDGNRPARVEIFVAEKSCLNFERLEALRGYLKRGARDAAEIVDAVGKHDIIGEAFAFRERRKLKRIKYDFIDCIDRGRVAGKSDGRRIDLVIKACKAHAGGFHKV